MALMPADGLMQRSAELFATLTCGDFAGFVEDFDNCGNPRVAGDDFFVTFDDRRTVAGLSAVAAIGGHVHLSC